MMPKASLEEPPSSSLILTLETEHWYAWEIFPASARHPNCAPFYLRSAIRVRGRIGWELSVAFALPTGELRESTLEVQPRKKSTGYWVCRLPGPESPEPTAVISLLNPEWLYVHCPALRPFLSHATPDRATLQSLLTETHLNSH